MDPSELLMHCRKDVEGREIDFVGVVGAMSIPLFDLFVALRQ